MNYKEIPYSEILTCDWFVSLADHDWNPGDSIRGLLHVEPSKLFEFFQHCEGAKEKCVVISAASDFSICNQWKHNPNRDLRKVCAQAASQDADFPTDKYIGWTLRAPLDYERCSLSHRYSVKIDRFTKLTFDKVPDCVAHWFVSNLDVHDLPRTSWLPFGLAPSHDPKQTRDYFENYRHDWTGRSIYVNFSENTAERAELRKYWARRPNVTVEANPDLSAEHYVDRLTRHGAVLCPAGNGLDCYRVYEALYCGRVPIVKSGWLSSHMLASGLPVFITDSLFDIDLNALWKFVESDPFRNADLRAITKSFWIEQIMGKCNQKL
jgi:hypothetical protein